MKVKVSDYIAEFFYDHGIRTIFTVVGGGAMHLNDSFGHSDKLKCIYNHHEQASAIAAEAYARVNNEMAAVCVTSGPGAINALTGVVGAYLDSIPMIVVSGQAKLSLTAANSGLKIRNLGIQDFDVTSMLDNAVKYAHMITDAREIRYCLEKAFHLALSGRPGPVWLEIPVDIQGQYIETDCLDNFCEGESDNYDTGEVLREKIEIIADRLEKSERPVIYAGNGIRIAGAAELLLELAAQADIPVVTCWDSIDLIESDSKHYAGRGGTMGDRAGNFAVQNSDFLLCIGNRLNINQVGYNPDTWARKAYVIDVDIDKEEMKKATFHLDLGIHCDAKVFIRVLITYLKENSINCDFSWWNEKCSEWKGKYPVVEDRHYRESKLTNVYAFMDCLSRSLRPGQITVVANGSASVVGSQSYYIGKNQRFIMNCGLSTMGYDLPAAIGASVATHFGEIICIAGDGSIQMNIQELQTIVTNNLPIKIFVINNNGYHQIRQTQNNIFNNGLVGVGPESGDLGFPDFEKIASAYGILYHAVRHNEELSTVIPKALCEERACICEVFCSITQKFEPKSATKKLDDGTLISPPLEDMAPFLSREELQKNMIVEMIEE